MGGRLNLDGGTLNLDGGTLTLDGGTRPPAFPQQFKYWFGPIQSKILATPMSEVQEIFMFGYFSFSSIEKQCCP